MMGLDGHHESRASPSISELLFLVMTRSAPSKQLSCSHDGKPMCLYSWRRVIGIGSPKIARIRRGERSLAKDKKPKHPVMGVSIEIKKGVKWPSVLMFLWYVYHSIAEGLPDRLVSLNELRGADGLVSKWWQGPTWDRRNNADWSPNLPKAQFPNVRGQALQTSVL